MTDHDPQTCSQCRMPIGAGATGLRHFGTHTAHSASECTRLLHAELERLRAEVEALRAGGEPVAYLFKHTHGKRTLHHASEYAIAYRDTCLEMVPLYTTPPAPAQPEAPGQGTSDDLAAAADLVVAINRAKTNGEMLALVLGYRKTIRAAIDAARQEKP